MEIDEARAIPAIEFGIDIVGRIVIMISQCQVVHAANGERLPVNSPIGRDRLEFEKAGTIPPIEFGIYIVGRSVVSISHGQVMVAANGEKFPVKSAIGGNRLEFDKLGAAALCIAWFGG